jgi:GMP synthase-like glutamine amidotransferase
MHRDHVPEIPPGFILLGSTAVSPIQGMVLPYPALGEGTVPSAAETHILTVQGHPEFTGPIVEKMVDFRAERGIIDAERAAKAREDAYKQHDGLGVVGQAIWKVMLNRLA